MKNLLYLFLIGILFSCGGSGENELNPEEPDVNGEPKEYIVSLGMTGEIEISESPLLGRASSNDLYGVQVYSKTTGTEYTPYAYGLFDDQSKMTIKLLEGYQYKFIATMVVNGKNKIVARYNKFTSPFGLCQMNDSELKNTFEYSNDIYFDGIELSYAYIYISEDKNTFRYPNIDRFHGNTSGYVPETGGRVTINMKRVVFGVKFIAEDLTEGKLKINIKDAPELHIKYGENTETEDVFTFGNKNGNWTDDNYSETIPVTVSWEKADGAIVPLVSQDITFKRKTLTTITIKVKDSSVNNGVEISQEPGDLIPGDNITIESGAGVDNPVNPDI